MPDTRDIQHDFMLRGFTIGITADRRWDEQASLFERRGATVVHAPTIRTLPLGSDEHLKTATAAVIARPPDVLIANTGLGIRSWVGAAESWGVDGDLLDALSETKTFARGPKASGAIHSLGLDVAARAPSERLSEAVDLSLEHLGPGTVAAIQLDGSGTTSPEVERLRASGADVLEIPVYEWRLPDDPQPAVRLAESVISGRVHAVTFTTGPAVKNWMSICAEHDLETPLRDALVNRDVVVGCVGHVCADVAIASGLGSANLVIPEKWRLGPLVRAVADQLVRRRVDVRLGGAPMSVAGNVATVDDGEPIELSDTEARLLRTLASRPDVVFAKSDLLATVWGDRSTDPHVVEVAIGRLRQRLGHHGSSIASVYRRGYALRTA
jgi:uroporphyrinogen-III synthase